MCSYIYQEDVTMRDLLLAGMVLDVWIPLKSSQAQVCIYFISLFYSWHGWCSMCGFHSRALSSRVCNLFWYLRITCVLHYLHTTLSAYYLRTTFVLIPAYYLRTTLCFFCSMLTLRIGVRMCVCMYVCMYACMHVFIYTIGAGLPRLFCSSSTPHFRTTRPRQRRTPSTRHKFSKVYFWEC
jgi:hypothetical protein